MSWLFWGLAWIALGAIIVAVWALVRYRERAPWEWIDRNEEAAYWARRRKAREGKST